MLRLECFRRVKDDTDDMGGMWAQRNRHTKMFVIKRDGKQERVSFDKVTSRIEKLAYGLNQQFVDPCLISQKVVKGLYAGVKTADLDTLAAETAVQPSTVNQKCFVPNPYPCLTALPCWLPAPSELTGFLVYMVSQH